MKIKKLVWEDYSYDETVFVTTALIGDLEYHIQKDIDEEEYFLNSYGGFVIDNGNYKHKTLEEAKQAAQDDWENKLKKFLED